MVQPTSNLKSSVEPISKSKYILTIKVLNNFINDLYEHSLKAHQVAGVTYGFAHGAAPISYIKENFKVPILSHIKDALFIHCVDSFLYKSIIDNKLSILEQPKLIAVDVNLENDAIFKFEVECATPVKKKSWSDFSFKPPLRKGYKDLDRQVESFIKEETDNLQNRQKKISIGDWVCYNLTLLDGYENALLNGYKNNLWIRVGEEEADISLHELFVGRSLGDKFLSKNKILQDYINEEFNISYTFLVEIEDIVPGTFFDFEQFKNHFNLKTKSDLDSKLIEVFSYRNNLSLRRETVENILAMLCKNYFVEIPYHLLKAQEKNVLDIVRLNPDYHVYRVQDDFNNKIKMLAEKQLKELAIIDTIGFTEHITVNHADIVNYLNLTKRQRTKDFIYFLIPDTKIDGLEAPISSQRIRQYCLREKTLNYILQNLTQRNIS